MHRERPTSGAEMTVSSTKRPLHRYGEGHGGLKRHVTHQRTLGGFWVGGAVGGTLARIIARSEQVGSGGIASGMFRLQSKARSAAVVFGSGSIRVFVIPVWLCYDSINDTKGA